MPSEYEFRLRFRTWLLDHDLEPEVADAILETMPPFDWSNIARRDEVLRRDEGALRVDVDRRFDGVDRRLDHVDAELMALRTDVRTMSSDLRKFTMDFHRMSQAIVMSMVGMAITLAVFAVTAGFTFAGG